MVSGGDEEGIGDGVDGCRMVGDVGRGRGTGYRMELGCADGDGDCNINVEGVGRGRGRSRQLEDDGCRGEGGSVYGLSVELEDAARRWRMCDDEDRVEVSALQVVCDCSGGVVLWRRHGRRDEDDRGDVDMNGVGDEDGDGDARTVSCRGMPIDVGEVAVTEIRTLIGVCEDSAAGVRRSRTACR